jgi:nicotinamide-nucleotide amidase
LPIDESLTMPSLDIAVLTIGDELLSGELADTNTASIGRLLGAHGFTLRTSLTVGDCEEDIGRALQQLVGRHQVIIVTGGLGPTADDLTARAAALSFGRRLALNDEALRQIRDFFRQRGKEMHPRNEKQALLPQKALVLTNRCGTAPGFCLQVDGCDLFFLPGVPEEMAAMLSETVLPQLLKRGGGNVHLERILTLFGLAEPRAEELLTAAPLPHGVTVAWGVDFPMVLVKLRANGEEADSLLDRAEVVVRRSLGEHVVAIGEQTLTQNVAALLIDYGLTLALAESCTGGLLSAMLTEVAGASAFLERAAVTYANSAKEQWLGVPAELLASEGAVSEKCALAMARGMRQAAGTDLALSITGIAGPTGGTPVKPVGTVYLALSSADRERVKGYRFAGNRQQVRRMAACMALEWLRRYMMDRPLEER